MNFSSVRGGNTAKSLSGLVSKLTDYYSKDLPSFVLPARSTDGQAWVWTDVTIMLLQDIPV